LIWDWNRRVNWKKSTISTSSENFSHYLAKIKCSTVQLFIDVSQNNLLKHEIEILLIVCFTHSFRTTNGSGFLSKFRNFKHKIIHRTRDFDARFPGPHHRLPFMYRTAFTISRNTSQLTSRFDVYCSITWYAVTSWCKGLIGPWPPYGLSMGLVNYCLFNLFLFLCYFMYYVLQTMSLSTLLFVCYCAVYSPL